MKLRMKNIALFAALGLVIAVVGLLMGANRSGLYFGRTGLHMGSDEYVKIEKLDVGEIKSIRVDMPSTDINIKRADRYGYEIMHRKDAGVSHTIENGDLVIEQSDKNRFSIIQLGFYQDVINIYLPSGTDLGVVDIKDSSGDLNVGELRCKTLKVDLWSGDCNIDELAADDAEIKASSGNVRLGEATAKSFDINLMSGNFSASRIDSEKLDAKLSSGDTELSGVFKGATNIRSSSGDIELNIDGAERDYDRNIRATSGDIEIGGKEIDGGDKTDFDAANSLDIHVSSGDVEITFKN